VNNGKKSKTLSKVWPNGPPGASCRRLLERIADEAQLEQPATMFLGPQHFESAVAKAEKNIKYDQRHQTMLGMLRRTLFVDQHASLS